ncbi:MAG: hypothetical protein A2Y10_13685 [Planctomycetes bacterium GWF2_41_51]|nr:MAG: hypothetical protein A2Y10_13685 [Planctomycetes bacterium GWF2_41_51]HBG27353.1 hypothetical protein [Phycisphaerales bacterium]
MWNVFEYPFVGIGIGLVTFIGLWIFRIVRPDKKRRWHYLVPLGIYIAAFALAYFVQTDKEKIFAAVNKGIAAFQEKNIEPIKEIIADDYADSQHSSKTYIVAYCQGLFETAAVEKVTFFSRQMEIENANAAFTFEAMVKFAEQSHIAQMGKAFLIVKAKLDFKKTPDKRWVITSSEILELDRNPINWNQLR